MGVNVDNVKERIKRIGVSTLISALPLADRKCTAFGVVMFDRIKVKFIVSDNEDFYILATPKNVTEAFKEQISQIVKIDEPVMRKFELISVRDEEDYFDVVVVKSKMKCSNEDRDIEDAASCLSSAGLLSYSVEKSRNFIQENDLFLRYNVAQNKLTVAKQLGNVESYNDLEKEIAFLVSKTADYGVNDTEMLGKNSCAGSYGFNLWYMDCLGKYSDELRESSIEPALEFSDDDKQVYELFVPSEVYTPKISGKVKEKNI